MRKIFTLFSFSVLCTNAFSQRLVVEDFNYAAGGLTEQGIDNVANGKWNTITASSYDVKANVINGNLSYPGYYTSPTETSRKLLLSRTMGGGAMAEDVFTNFTAVTSGTLYASALFKLTETTNLPFNSSGGEYFMAFSPTSNASDYRARVFVRLGSVANTIQFGIAPTSSDLVWSTVNRPALDVHLITIAYQRIAGANNDVVKLWVDQPIAATEPIPDAQSTYATGTEPVDISRFNIRQATTLAPVGEIDAIVVATTYAAALPLNLTSFTGSLVNKASLLNWTSANEVNVEGFAVEKGLNGVTFSEIGFVAAKNTAAINTYSFEDNNVKGGANFYRLNMKDKDGSSRYSAVVVVNSQASVSAQVFPNPARSSMNVSHEKAARGASIQLISLSGKVLRTIPVQAGATQTGLSVNDLVKGNYMVVFDNGGAKAVTQFTKQ